ncbi:catabolite repression HPr-like protein/phosphocarrier protein [Neobacillus bataviensis]|uniref:Catabolite repression HPr-like protein/phosphocarrier protein n=1 Tax=Neobacillus bataviensis TaxID=220685 RepID=A0A561CZC3_9BACI|nr:HPr family phosphocarrier protein [Neobacillus bataviensis]TWD96422.1 catabolite repression HPr-like protein/phosphocarrier protein [Neobacillus bataviensis]
MRVKEIKVKKNLSVDELIKFIKTANKFESDIKIRGTNFTIDAKSIIGVLTIVRAGIDVTIITKGDDDEEALKAIINLLI